MYIKGVFLYNNKDYLVLVVLFDSVVKVREEFLFLVGRLDEKIRKILLIFYIKSIYNVGVLFMYLDNLEEVEVRIRFVIKKYIEFCELYDFLIFF